MRFNILFLLIPLYCFANPWGKDADLHYQSECPPPPKEQPHLGIRFSAFLIRFHQEVISPIDGPRSHYLPSSSQYTLDAIRKYGFFKGWILGSDRLQRENDEVWIYPTTIDPQGNPIKWDPVK